MSETYSRRTFLRQAITVGALGIGGGALLSACGKKEGGEKPAAAGAAGGCDDVSALAAADQAFRKTNEYKEASTEAGKNCEGCQLFTPPVGGAACGACKVLKGSVNPAGWCKLWAKKA